MQKSLTKVTGEFSFRQTLLEQTMPDPWAEFASRAAEDPAPTTAADPRGTTGESMSDTERKPSLWSQFVAALGGNEDGIPPAPAPAEAGR